MGAGEAGPAADVAGVSGLGPHQHPSTHRRPDRLGERGPTPAVRPSERAVVWHRLGRALDAAYLANAGIPADTADTAVERWIDERIREAWRQAYEVVYAAAGIDPPKEEAA